MDDLKYYELHVTVAPDKVLTFADFCKSTGAKPLYIQLDKGLHRNQLMVAVTHMLQDDDTASGWARDYEKTLKPHFTVLRTKLESRLTEGPNEYYEAHWKLDFNRRQPVTAYYWECTLNNLIKRHPTLLRSHNLFDTCIHYLSQRIYSCNDPLAASKQFADSGDIIKNFYGLPLVKTHYERCVWDSNPALDYGWHG
jgi:hypothetical protein